MTKEEFAKMLDGRKYGMEIFPMESRMAKENGLVVVFGVSDDMMEFEGAILNEVSCYEGGTAYLDRYGLWTSLCEHEDCPYAKLDREKCEHTIMAVWDDVGEPSWSYETNIPHATFNIYCDGELYCVGIVFEMDALKGV